MDTTLARPACDEALPGFRQAFRQALLAVIRSAAERRTHLECESALYIPAKAHRAATGEDLPADAYVPGPAEPVGEWGFDFDDQPEMKRRLPRLTALFWPDAPGRSTSERRS